MGSRPGLKFHTWLEVQINTGQFSGLEYVDVEKKRFRIPWNKKYTEESEDRLFKAYSMYKGPCTTNSSKMKSKFRNTLSKCPYIDVECEDLNNQEKNFKVMRFLEPHEIEERKKKLRKRNGKNSPQSSPGEASTSSPDSYVNNGQSPIGIIDEAEQLEEILPQLNLQDCYDAGVEVDEEMEYSYVQDLFEPLTDLHRCLQPLNIPLADLGKFTLSICYQGTVVHCELFDLLVTPIWLLHGSSIEQYMEIVANKRKLEIHPLRPLQLPHNSDVKEILDHSTLGFAIRFNYQSLKLEIQRFSRSRIFERNCGREKKIERNVLHEGFGFDSLVDYQNLPISERLKFEFTIGHSSHETNFPHISIQLQSAVTQKIEQIVTQGGNHFTNQPRAQMFHSEETSVDRSVERVKLEQR